MTEDEELDALYAAPLGSFIDARKAAAGRLKSAGDKAAAARVLATPKPTPAAWAINALWRREKESFASLLDIGTALRAALRDAFAGRVLAGASAALQKQQRDAVASLVKKGETLLSAGEVSAGQVVFDGMATTLRTISTTGAWGGAQPGRLPKELGEADLASLAALLVDDVAAALGRPTAQPASRQPPSPPPSSHERVARPSPEATPKKHAPAAATREDASKRAAAAAEAERRRRAVDEARKVLEHAERQEKQAREDAEAASRSHQEAMRQRDAAARELEAVRRRSDLLHRAAEQAARAAQEASLEVERGAGELIRLERDEVVAERAARGAGAHADEAATVVAAARGALEAASRA